MAYQSKNNGTHQMPGGHMMSNAEMAAEMKKKKKKMKKEDMMGE